MTGSSNAPHKNLRLFVIFVIVAFAISLSIVFMGDWTHNGLKPSFTSMTLNKLLLASPGTWKLSATINNTRDVHVHYIPHESTNASEDRIWRFNIFLRKQQKQMADQQVKKVTSDSNTTVTYDKYSVARELKMDYFRIIANYTDIKTFALMINEQFDLADSSVIWMDHMTRRQNELPSFDVYPFSLEKGACSLFVSRRFDETWRLLDKTLCQDRQDFSVSLQPLKDDEGNLYTREYLRALDSWERIFLHVIPNGRVSGGGVVLHKNLYIEPLVCGPHAKTFKDAKHMSSEKWRNNSAIVDEVFVVAQKWGAGFYHWNVEVISRLAPYLEFLKMNEKMKILVSKNAEKKAMSYLHLLGVGNLEERVISGDTVGRVVYLPQGPKCGEKVSNYGLAIASRLYRRYIKNNLQPSHNRDTIILIHRTAKRFLKQHQEIKTMLEESANENRLKFVVFSDTNLPSFNETMRLFYRAALVVAPHGAGLVNTMFSQPATVVIEALCPHRRSVLCYPYLVRAIGHVYYGIRHDKSSAKKFCSDIWMDLKLLRQAVDFYIKEHILKTQQ